MDGVQFMQPPPNLSAPPPVSSLSEGHHGGLPNMAMPPPGMGPGMNGPPPSGRGGHGGRGGGHFFRPFVGGFPRGPTGGPMTQDDFDGKRLRKSVMRKTVDYNSAVIKVLQNRVWERDYRDRRALQPDPMYIPDLLPPPSYQDNPTNAVTTKFVKTATNKMRCPIFTLAWTPEGRRLVTGASSGEFTLWNGLTFNFETILQAHDSPVRTMVWSHNDNWMVTGDHGGYVKYWQSNMNNVKMFQAHKEALRGISFSPTDSKFVSCSDDGTLRIWDFLRCQEERVLRGHGADVKCVHWHPQKGLIVSGSKDNQQPIKLWDPKSGQALATLHAHKSTVMDLKWNDNGNWLVTASRDHLLKLFDLRNLNQEVQVFRGHKKEASSVAWHPTHEGLFCSGGSDGSILFWHVGTDKEVGGIDSAHDSIVWTLAWHPLGHILCSGSNDHTIKFWTRNRPGDQMRDKYNLNTLPAGLAGLDDVDLDEPSVIPGMGPDDKIDITDHLTGLGNSTAAIPGLDLDTTNIGDDKLGKSAKKVPYSKPIPRNFQAQWNDTGNKDEDEEDSTTNDIKEVITQIVENTPGVVPLQKITPTGIILYGKLVPVKSGSKLQAAIAEGPEALNKFVASGEIEELHDVMPHEDNYSEDYLNDDDNSQDTYSESTLQKNKMEEINPPVKRSRFSDIDHKPTFIYGDRFNPPMGEQGDFNLAKSLQSNMPSLMNTEFRDPDIRNAPGRHLDRDQDINYRDSIDDVRDMDRNMIRHMDRRDMDHPYRMPPANRMNERIPNSQNFDRDDQDFRNNSMDRYDQEDNYRERDRDRSRDRGRDRDREFHNNDGPWPNNGDNDRGDMPWGNQQTPPHFRQFGGPGNNQKSQNNQFPNNQNFNRNNNFGPNNGPGGPNNWNMPPRMEFRGRGGSHFNGPRGGAGEGRGGMRGGNRSRGGYRGGPGSRGGQWRPQNNF